ncbi:MAG: tetratricopeptide repeat protein [Acidobacteria bacterium]|nr:tetratricopeptide repeat protein [Acidobacteriota bacterium]
MPIWAEGLPEDMSVEQRVAGLWQEYKAAKSSQDSLTQKTVFESLRDVAKGSRGTVYEEAAILFLREGNRELELGNYNEARVEFLNSAQLNPYLWPAYSGLARIKKESEGDYLYYITLNLKGLKYAFNSRNTLFVMDVLVWLFERLLLAFKLGLIALIGIFVLKYAKPIFATTKEHFDHFDWHPLLKTGVVVGLVTAPWVLGFSWFLSALFFWVFVYPFMTARERGVTMFAVLAYALTVFFLFASYNLINARSSEETQLQLAQFFNGDPRIMLSQLEEEVATGRTSDVVYFALGSAYLETGDADNALSYLDKVSDQSDYGVLATVNKGNIYLASRELQKAATAYESAVGRLPRSGVVLYNMSVAKSQLGEHRDAESYLRRAKGRDPQLIEAIYLRGDSEATPVEISYDPLQSISRGLLGQGLGDLTNWLMRPVSLAIIVALIIAVLAALIHARSRNPRLLGKSCSKCGMIYYIPESPAHNWCSQCVNLYVRRDDLPSEAKMKKYDEVQRYSKFKRRFTNGLQLLIPGAKSIMRGNPWMGALVAWFWVLMLVFCFSSLSDIKYPFMANMNDFLVIQASIWATTAFFWLLFGLRGLWMED